MRAAHRARSYGVQVWCARFDLADQLRIDGYVVPERILVLRSCLQSAVSSVVSPTQGFAGVWHMMHHKPGQKQLLCMRKL